MPPFFHTPALALRPFLTCAYAYARTRVYVRVHVRAHHALAPAYARASAGFLGNPPGFGVKPARL